MLYAISKSKLNTNKTWNEYTVTLMFIVFISSVDSSIVQRRNRSMNLKEKAITTRKEKHNVWKLLDLRQCQRSCQGQMRSYFIRNNEFAYSMHKENYMEIRIQNEFMCYMNKNRLMYYYSLGSYWSRSYVK